MLKDRVTRAGWRHDRYLVELDFDLGTATLTLQPDGELALRGETATVGPGYHADVIGRVEPILDELDYAWTEPFDLAATQDAMCTWLAGELRGAAVGAGQVRIGVPQQFRIDAPLLTPLGPRDDAWCAAVRADPRRAADAFAWWDTGPGRAERARALRAMWLDVPWREPLDGNERELMKRVDADLREARKANLELPWPDWKQLLAHIGIEDEDVNERAGDSRATIGYRRHDLIVELSGGWQVSLPGAMVGHWEDDGARYWATDGERAVEFTSLTATDETDSARLLAVAPERYAVLDRLVDGERHGRAEAFDEGVVHVVIGLMACAPHVGILTCKGGDEAWALATWRSLQR